jgi:hypothetical protein
MRRGGPKRLRPSGTNHRSATLRHMALILQQNTSHKSDLTNTRQGTNATELNATCSSLTVIAVPPCSQSFMSGP